MTLLPYILILLYAESCLCMGPWVLRCPYTPDQKDMPRVWCKRTSAECCSGIFFNSSVSQLENGAVMVQQDSGTYSLRILQLSQGEGVYWCGLLNTENYIIKLAEMEIQHDLLNDVWWILRWILMAVLLTIIPAMQLCSWIKEKNKFGDEAMKLESRSAASQRDWDS
ncbi:trem-like transcript 4 protein [Brienomyrus brachyistius]|uniref:trem-like transcript 4 protein n=1 Tax=Brienomyrus brachyistius TaxID=42636 RepID=UPI0020B34AAB|nr:trem-like transcript 4 protein [Brienomyrus brachyistius]